MPYHKLYRFAKTSELLLVFLGIITSILSALAIPLTIVLYGEFTTILIDRVKEVESSTPTLILSLFGGGRILYASLIYIKFLKKILKKKFIFRTNATTEENRGEILQDAKAFGLGNVSVSLFQFITMSISVYLLNLAAQKQICTIRKEFFKSVLRQEQAWYDLNQSDNFAVKLNE